MTSELARKALEAGARGYVLKSDAGDVLLQAVRSVLTESIFFTPAISELVVRSFVDSGTRPRDNFMSAATLSGREREILQMLAEGRTTKEVSVILGTSAFTVETQRKSIMRKLQLHTLSDLIRYAIRNQFVEI